MTAPITIFRPNDVPVLHTVRRVRLSSGEDMPMVLDRFKLAAFWPSVYLSHRRGLAVNTLDARARTLAMLEDYLAHNGINFEARVRKGNFLTPAETGALKEHLRLVGPKTAAHRSAFKGVSRSLVGFVEWRSRLLCAVDYLDEVSTQLIEGRGSAAEVHLSLERRRDAMLFRLLPHFNVADSIPTRGLSKLQQKIFRAAIAPRSDTNPFSTERVRKANYVYLAMLDALGSRRGEPQLLKVVDLAVLDARPAIHLHPNSDDRSDTRRQRPSLKRAPRQLVLADALAKLLHEYINGYRRSVGENLERNGDLERLAAFKRNPYIFVSETGAPLSTSVINAMFLALRTVAGLPPNFSPRILRNTWNDRQVEKEHEAAKKGQSVPHLQDLRRQRMGWSKKTRMLEHYAKNAIESLANDATHDASIQFESIA